MITICILSMKLIFRINGLISSSFLFYAKFSCCIMRKKEKEIINMNKVVQELAIKTFSAVYSVVVTQIVYEGLKAVCYKVQESKK